jgi:aerobic carbon-monoxide dehydrogenase medium subunit
MIPAPFEYYAPKSVEEALRLAERHGDEAKFLAGGHSLLPLMKLRLASPRFVIDLGRLRDLSYIRLAGDHIAIGAMTSHATVAASELLHEKCPLLAETASEISDVQVRNRGTMGGSLAHADPGGDYPAAVLALDAQIVSVSSRGTRTIPATEFFVDLLTTQLQPGEILTEVRVPVLHASTGTAYRKLHQAASGFAVVGAAARVTVNKDGVIERVALGITGLGAKAFRATRTEEMLLGAKSARPLIAQAAQHAGDGVEALADMHASAEYRTAMAAVYAERALDRAVARAARPHGAQQA